MNLLSNRTSIGFGISTPMTGTGGTGLYTYSVIAGGAGGSINASTGVYVAPNIPGVDTIKAVDSLGAYATVSINILSALGLLCDVIKTELQLDDDQVYIYNQKFAIPPDSRLYIAVGIESAKPFSNAIRSTASGLASDQYANFKSTHDINIMSTSEEALNRKEEVVMSFVSKYSQRQQAANNFHIAPLPSQLTNLSELEGEKIPFRFNISVNLQYVSKKVQSTEYYDTFNNPSILTNNP